MPVTCRKKGEISVFLVLLLTVIAGFIITLVSSVRGSVSKCEAVYAVDNAVRSCFAEYNRKLFERFNILLIDSSYKGEENGIDRVREHFLGYLQNSISQSVIGDINITEYGAVSENDSEYMYRQAVKYARGNSLADSYGPYIDDSMYFLAYLCKMLGNHSSPCDDAVREGEWEYLVYGYDQDEENIEQALSDYEGTEGISYEDYLRSRMEAEEDAILRQRFSYLVAEYLRENGSPGYDPYNSFYSMTVIVTLEGKTGEYRITRTYDYETGEI